MPQTLTERTEALNASIINLENALDVSHDYLEPYQIVRTEQDLEKLQDRVERGVGLTVAALAGGTGSGKSSTFNALTGLEFADAGEIRPMTQEAAACVWHADASALLDMLEVRPTRRINHDSPLIDVDEAYDGLILLDLPDHDSIQLGHSALVDKMLPMVDILIWVLDPQKYADHLIHDSYLAQMRRRKEHMIVLMNQIDTVVPERVDDLLTDVRNKLADDGLDGVPVYPVSALHKTGFEPVREHIKAAIAATMSNVATAEAELDAIRIRLRDGVGDKEFDITDEETESIVAQIADNVGIPAVVESLRHAGTSIRPAAIARPEKPAISLTNATRDKWMSQVKDGLPERWRDQLEAAVPEAENVRRDIGNALDKLPAPTVSTALPRVLQSIGILVGILGLLQFVFSWPIPSLPVRIAVAVAGLVIALILRPITHRMQLTAAHRMSQRFNEEAYLAIRQVVREDFVKPSAEVLDIHRKLRQELARTYS